MINDRFLMAKINDWLLMIYAKFRISFRIYYQLTLIHEWGGLGGPGGSVFNCFGTYSVPTVRNFCDFSFKLVTKNIVMPSSQNNKYCQCQKAKNWQGVSLKNIQNARLCAKNLLVVTVTNCWIDIAVADRLYFLIVLLFVCMFI